MFIFGNRIENNLLQAVAWLYLQTQIEPFKLVVLYKIFKILMFVS